MGKSLILAVQIIGDARSAIQSVEDTSSAFEKLTKPAAIAGAAAGAALTKGFFDAVSAEAGLSKVQGQLDLSEAEAARVGTVSAELYANGWGSGADQINEALSSVIGNVEGMRTATDAELTGISQGVLTVANTFDQDLGGITTAVGQLMRTGMATDAEHALDIITTGLQSNTRAGDDLLDTFTEYPALFERLGIDGQTATGLIAQGLDAGARSTDLVADALKEFQIRATDGSTASAEGFAALGINATAMTAQIAAGGEGASAGLDLVLDSLRGMTDPVAQNAAAVALFGTQAEDLGGALYALDPSTAVTALGEVGGAATGLSATMRDDAQVTITEFTRGIQTSFQDVAANAIPVIQPILDLLTQFAPILGPVAVVIAAVSAGILIMNGAMKAWAAVQAFQTAVQWANNAAWLASPITWIILAIIAAIAAIVVIVVLVVKHWDQIKEAGVAAWEAIVGWVQQAIGWLGDKITAPIRAIMAVFENLRAGAVAVFENIIQWVRNAIDWLLDLARNAIPGWAQDLLGMSRMSMTVEPQLLALDTPTFAGRMMIEPELESFTAPSYATDAPQYATTSFSAMSLLAPTAAQRSGRPAATIQDNRRYEINFPNYLGDRAEIIEEIRDGLEEADARSERVTRG